MSKPIPWRRHTSRRLPRRLVQLYGGLFLYGFSMALMLRASLGNMPWDVLHEGLTERTGWPFGLTSILVGATVLLAWIPLRERPGLGTISNVVVVGLAADAALAVLAAPTAVWARIGMAVLGVLLNGVATAAYSGVQMGPGPRDGLMTGLVRRTGRSIRLIRTCIEVLVVIVGWLLGGTFGAVTVLYALSIGPLTQALLPHFTVRGLSRG